MTIRVGESIRKIEVVIDTSMTVTKIKIEKLTIIGVSDSFAVLDDSCFEKLAMSKTFAFCHAKPEEVLITESKSDFDITYFGKFRLSIASQMTEKRIENKLNRKFNEWISEKLGIYGAAKNIPINLSDANNSA